MRTTASDLGPRLVAAQGTATETIKEKTELSEKIRRKLSAKNYKEKYQFLNE